VLSQPASGRLARSFGEIDGFFLILHLRFSFLASFLSFTLTSAALGWLIGAWQTASKPSRLFPFLLFFRPPFCRCPVAAERSGDCARKRGKPTEQKATELLTFAFPPSFFFRMIAGGLVRGMGDTMA
jgi:hypothetical protein